MALKTPSTSNGVKSVGINSISASISPNGKVPRARDKNRWNVLNWMKVFPLQLKNNLNSKVKPKSSEVNNILD